MIKRRTTRVILAGCVYFALSTTVAAQTLRGVVVDQTGLPLPGVHLEQLRRDAHVAATTAAADGTFEFDATEPNDQIKASLQGFQITTVDLREAARIIMPLEGTAEHTDVVASALAPAGIDVERLGSALTAAEAQMLPTARPRALEALPMLPSVMRGPDGLLRLDGTRPHEAALWIDGFDVTDPVTGFSAIDPPLEAVKGVVVLRDPMAATVGGMLGALASLETVSGGDKFSGGVQGFIPRPRFSRRYGVGHIDGFFPRANAGGRLGHLRYFIAEEFDFERVPIPGVTTRRGGPTLGNVSATSLGRIDLAVSAHQTITLVGIVVPGHTTMMGLSPVRDASAAPAESARDRFVGLTDQWVVGKTSILTLRVGILAHRTAISRTGKGAARLLAEGWRGNWFASVDHRASRRSAVMSWERGGLRMLGPHTLTAVAGFQQQYMRGSVSHEPIRIEDADARLVRLIAFGPAGPLRASDATVGLVLRDLWDVSARLQVEAGARLDSYRLTGQGITSPRLAVRYAIDGSGATVLKAGAGRFVGRVPLGALAFGAFPTRSDSSFDPETGDIQSVSDDRPELGRLCLPRADTVVVEVERRLRPGLDVQVSGRRRVGSRLSTVNVPRSGGSVVLASTGESAYREMQIAVRQLWGDQAQVFLSYVRSATRGELNDFGTLFTDMDAPQLEPGSRTLSSDDVPNRIVGWASIPLLRDMVVAPAVEWRSGFPYTILDIERRYLAAPNSARFPDFFSLDLVVYKTVDVRDRRINLGLQLFNVTSHSNPRDVRPVLDTPASRRFTNSVGLGVGGYMMVKWQ